MSLQSSCQSGRARCTTGRFPPKSGRSPVRYIAVIRDGLLRRLDAGNLHCY